MFFSIINPGQVEFYRALVLQMPNWHCGLIQEYERHVYLRVPADGSAESDIPGGTDDCVPMRSRREGELRIGLGELRGDQLCANDFLRRQQSEQRD